jgi:hypothetical protein
MARIGNKRQRAPHYIKGLGDGNLRPQNNAHTTVDDTYRKALRQSVRGKIATEKVDGRLAAQEHPGMNHDQWDLYFRESDAARAYSQRTESRPEALSVVVLLGCIVLLSALFIHFIADAASDSGTRGNRRKRRVVKIEKEKNDEWNDDVEEVLLSASLRGEESARIDTVASPPVYYPCQPLQEPRHRKNSSTVPGNTTPGGVRTYYLNQSGSAVVDPLPYQSPAPSSRGLRTTGTPVLGVSKITSGQGHDTTKNPPLSAIRATEISAGPLPGSPTPYGNTLSSISSLPSIEGSDQASNAVHSVDEEIGSPLRNSPCFSSLRVAPSRMQVSAGTDDPDETPHIRGGRKMAMSDFMAKTPLATNSQYSCSTKATPQSSQLQITRDSSGDTMVRLRTPSVQRMTNPDSDCHQEQATVPFMPLLDAGYPGECPPRSIIVDDLHLFQDIGSGVVEHWAARVAEESRLLESQVFAQPSEHLDITESTTENSSDSRPNIPHKRQHLTDDTDATASLQGAVDFSELNMIEIIGGGGFGQVWKAMWNGTPVAVKVLSGSAQSKNVPRSVLEEFAAEINLLRGMRHPNICMYMGASVVPPNRAIITELAANGSLWDALRLPLTAPYVACDGVSRESWPDILYQPDPKHGVPPSTATKRLQPPFPPRGTWPWSLVKEVAVGTARAMAYLHAGVPPVLHRDLKSANILLDKSYTAKVCDFGLSRLKAHERSMTGNCGTVQWMAPEVLANKSYNEKADVFSYGIICWELLTRECPYEGMTAIQCALAVLNRDRRPEIPKWCPQPLHALIRSCIKKNATERPNFAQIIHALDSMP